MPAKRRAHFASNQNYANSRRQKKTNERWHSWFQWRKVSLGANGSRLNGRSAIGDDRGNVSIYFLIREGKAIPAPGCSNAIAFRLNMPISYFLRESHVVDDGPILLAMQRDGQQHREATR